MSETDGDSTAGSAGSKEEDEFNPATPENELSETQDDTPDSGSLSNGTLTNGCGDSDPGEIDHPETGAAGERSHLDIDIHGGNANLDIGIPGESCLHERRVTDRNIHPGIDIPRESDYGRNGTTGENDSVTNSPKSELDSESGCYDCEPGKLTGPVYENGPSYRKCHVDVINGYDGNDMDGETTCTYPKDGSTSRHTSYSVSFNFTNHSVDFTSVES